MNQKATEYQSFVTKNPNTFDVTTLKAPKDMAQYLSNRLWKAWGDGYEAGRQAGLEQVEAKLKALIRGEPL